MIGALPQRRSENITATWNHQRPRGLHLTASTAPFDECGPLPTAEIARLALSPCLIIRPYPRSFSKIRPCGSLKRRIPRFGCLPYWGLGLPTTHRSAAGSLGTVVSKGDTDPPPTSHFNFLLPQFLQRPSIPTVPILSETRKSRLHHLTSLLFRIVGPSTLPTHLLDECAFQASHAALILHLDGYFLTHSSDDDPRPPPKGPPPFYHTFHRVERTLFRDCSPWLMFGMAEARLRPSEL